MPFTPGHPAIILPFINFRYLSATGLIIGSTSPDFEYFFKMSVDSIHSHSRAGLFYFDLPVTIVLSLIFHQLVKTNFIQNLPLFFQKRFQETLQFQFWEYLKKNWWIFLYSALIGAASHLLWDSFTHNNRFFTRQFSSIYQNTSISFYGVRYPLFYVLQQVSTVVGLTIVLLYIVLKKPSENQKLMTPKLTYWLAVFAVAIVVLRLRFFIYPADYNLGNVVVSSISGLIVGVVFCGFINFRNEEHYEKSLNG